MPPKASRVRQTLAKVAKQWVKTIKTRLQEYIRVTISVLAVNWWCVRGNFRWWHAGDSMWSGLQSHQVQKSRKEATTQWRLLIFGKWLNMRVYLQTCIKTCLWYIGGNFDALSFSVVCPNLYTSSSTRTWLIDSWVMNELLCGHDISA